MTGSDLCLLPDAQHHFSIGAQNGSYRSNTPLPGIKFPVSTIPRPVDRVYPVQFVYDSGAHFTGVPSAFRPLPSIHLSLPSIVNPMTNILNRKSAFANRKSLNPCLLFFLTSGKCMCKGDFTETFKGCKVPTVFFIRSLSSNLNLVRKWSTVAQNPVTLQQETGFFVWGSGKNGWWKLRNTNVGISQHSQQRSYNKSLNISYLYELLAY